jgi:hypothetical protein
MKNSMNTTRNTSTLPSVAGAFGAVMLCAGSAKAAPLAATVASTPLVVGGVLVGLALLAGFTLVLLRSVRTMKSHQGEDRVEVARKESEQIASAYLANPSLDNLKVLVEELREASSGEEAQVWSSTLSRLTGRYFGEDDLAWEVWLRRDGAKHVASLSGHSSVNDSEALPVS